MGDLSGEIVIYVNDKYMSSFDWSDGENSMSFSLEELGGADMQVEFSEGDTMYILASFYGEQQNYTIRSVPVVLTVIP